MITTMSLAQTSSLMTWSTLGYALLAIGLIATLLSSYRYLLAYLLAGMVYWLIVDGLQSALLSLFEIDSWRGYIYSLATTWLLLSISFILRLNSRTRTAKPSKKPAIAKSKYKEKYIEHTPVYTDYQPRFPNPNAFNRNQLHR